MSNSPPQFLPSFSQSLFGGENLLHIHGEVSGSPQQMKVQHWYLCSTVTVGPWCLNVDQHHVKKTTETRAAWPSRVQPQLKFDIFWSVSEFSPWRSSITWSTVDLFWGPTYCSGVIPSPGEAAALIESNIVLQSGSVVDIILRSFRCSPTAHHSHLLWALRDEETGRTVNVITWRWLDIKMTNTSPPWSLITTLI